MSSASRGTARSFSRLALALIDTSSLARICDAIESGLFNRGSGGATRAALACGDSTVEMQLLELQKAWTETGEDITAPALALALRSIAATAEQVHRQSPSVQVVWTGPGVDGSYLRATREVVREIIRGAREELLIVGYWIVARDDGDGIIAEIIALLAEALQRGVRVNVVVDERTRIDGRDNKSILISAWPHGAPLPTLRTWRLPPDDEHLKLHAKVIVADRADALVTSANLTAHAMNRNMEMGMRVTGGPALATALHFDLLVSHGVLVTYGGTDGPQ